MKSKLLVALCFTNMLTFAKPNTLVGDSINGATLGVEISLAAHATKLGAQALTYATTHGAFPLLLNDTSVGSRPELTGIILTGVAQAALATTVVAVLSSRRHLLNEHEENYQDITKSKVAFASAALAAAAVFYLTSR